MELEVEYFNTFIGRRLIADQDQYVLDTADTKINFLTVWPSTQYGDYATNGFPNTVFDESGGVLTPASPKSVVSNTQLVATESTRNAGWIIEEARIRGGYNNTWTDYGAKAYLIEETNDQVHRFNTIIFSGIYNSRTGYNETNVFSVGQNITKSCDPHYGPIQRLYSEDTNLTIFQENKVNRALIDKNVIYSGEQGSAETAVVPVMGQIVPYTGEYGISKNFRSFDYFGFRKYFSDKYRKSIMRLSKDGMTEISQYGMSDYFRDELAEIDDNLKIYCVEIHPNTVTQHPAWPYSTPPYFASGEPYLEIVPTNGNDDLTSIEVGMQLNIIASGVPTLGPYVTEVDTTNNKIHLNELPPEIGGSVTSLKFCKYVKDEIIGVYDTYKDNYILSLVKAKTSPDDIDDYQTVVFDERSLGWVSFFTYFPDTTISLRNNLYSTKSRSLYLHYNENVSKNSFYGSTPSDSSITFVFNAAPSTVKNFRTVNYEGSNGWEVDSFTSDTEGPNLVDGVYVNYIDTTKAVLSYDEGFYTENGIQYRVGFNRKENKYYANLKNDSVDRPGEVWSGNAVSGIKGYYATVKVSTDSSTEFGGMKELFAVSTEFTKSS